MQGKMISDFSQGHIFRVIVELTVSTKDLNLQ
jgi:hypothetical protein